MFSNYFQPISQKLIDFKNNLNNNQIGSQMICFENNEFPDITKVDIALMVIPENRGSSDKFAPSSYIEFRKSFYSLFQGEWSFRIADFGDLKLGESVKDSYFALSDIVSNLLSQSVFPVIIGGSHDLVFPIYQSYESFSKGVNLLCVDSRFDLIDAEISMTNSKNFVGTILKQENNHLNHFINLGYQSYFCQNDESHLLEKMFFESYRLGELRANIKESEPFVRSSDIVAIDLSSMKQSDSPGSSNPSPNGIEAHHACTISRYAGMSDRVSSFGIFEFNSLKDVNYQTTYLIGQIIWYFIEGFSLRINDYPSSKTINVNYQKYLIPIKDSNLEFVFYKSKKTNRWWFSSSLEYEEEASYKQKILPCSYEDYLATVSGDIPKRILRVLKSASI